MALIPASHASTSHIVYNTPIPPEWYAILLQKAQAANVPIYTLVRTAIDRIMPRHVQIAEAEKRNTTIMDVKRRLIKKAFPDLPEWDYPVCVRTARTPTVADDEAKHQAKMFIRQQKQLERINRVSDKRVANQVTFPLPPDEMVKLGAKAGGLSTVDKTITVSELARSVVRKWLRGELVTMKKARQIIKAEGGHVQPE